MRAKETMKPTLLYNLKKRMYFAWCDRENTEKAFHEAVKAWRKARTAYHRAQRKAR